VQHPDAGSLVLAFVDESYTPAEFHLGAVVVDARAARLIENGLDSLLRDYSGKFGLSEHTELHGHPLFQGRDEWREVPTRVRINIYRRAMAVVGSSGASIVLRGMDIERQQRRYLRPDPPHEVVLGHLLERVNAYAREHDLWALVLADEVHSQDRHRTNVRDFRSAGTPGYRSSTLPRLLDTIHFAPSHHSRLLQAADLVTFLHRRRRTHPAGDERAAAANEAIWSEVADAVAHCHCWTP
jgi:hypothetical protein